MWPVGLLYVAMADLKGRLPAGSESYDAANVRAMISVLVGALNNLSASIGDTLISGQR